MNDLQELIDQVEEDIKHDRNESFMCKDSKNQTYYSFLHGRIAGMRRVLTHIKDLKKKEDSK